MFSRGIPLTLGSGQARGYPMVSVLTRVVRGEGSTPVLPEGGYPSPGWGGYPVLGYSSGKGPGTSLWVPTLEGT